MTTDYQIKKELEYEIHKCEDNDRPYAYISRKLLENAVDLIKRQRAEIAKLEEYIYRCKSGEEYWVKCLLERPNESVKEFAERLKKNILCMEYIAETKRKTVSIEKVKELIAWILTKVVIDTVDKTVEEMVGDTK